MVPELSTANAGDWLARHGFPSVGLRFSELGGGISNKVILAEGPVFRAVLKQSLGQLRTELGWHSDRGRIFREAAAMHWNATNSRGRIPSVLFEEPETFTIAMEAAPESAEMWKTQLFRGEFDVDLARAAGVVLGSMIAGSWHNSDAERIFGDQTVFNQLRVDPYYRFTGERRPEARGYLQELIDRSATRRVSLVHGDWSPKNLLVDGKTLWAIDWEVIHYGDPSFDAGFLLNHLLLKSIAMPKHRNQIAALAEAVVEALSRELPHDGDWIIPAALEHLPALALARAEGKSPAEYLNPAMREQTRSHALNLMKHPAKSVSEVFAI